MGDASAGTEPSALTGPSSLVSRARLPGIRVEERGRLSALQGGDQVLRGEEPHGDPGVDGGASKVGDDHRVLQLQQQRMDLGLLLEHVDPRGDDLAVADRKSTRLNSSNSQISYAVFCLKKKK